MAPAVIRWTIPTDRSPVWETPRSSPAPEKTFIPTRQHHTIYPKCSFPHLPDDPAPAHIGTQTRAREIDQLLKARTVLRQRDCYSSSDPASQISMFSEPTATPTQPCATNSDLYPCVQCRQSYSATRTTIQRNPRALLGANYACVSQEIQSTLECSAPTRLELGSDFTCFLDFRF